MGLTVYEENHPWMVGTQLNNASGTSATNIITSARAGQRIDHLWVSNSDTVSREAQLLVSAAGGTTFTVGSLTIPAGTGFGVLPCVDLVETILPGQGGLVLQDQAIVQCSLVVAVTAGKVVVFLGVGGYI